MLKPQGRIVAEPNTKGGFPDSQSVFFPTVVHWEPVHRWYSQEKGSELGTLKTRLILPALLPTPIGMRAAKSP